MEAIGEVSSTSSNVNRRPPTPLQFRRPRWYQPPEPPCPEGVCEHHVVVCNQVAITLLGIKSPPLLPQEFEVEVLRIQIESYKMEDKIHQIPVIPVEARKERKRKRNTSNWAIRKNRKTKKETKTDEEKFEEEKKRVEDEKKREEERKKFNENWTKMMQVPKWTIKKGERYNISELLSSPTRDYLINHAGHQKALIYPES